MGRPRRVSEPHTGGGWTTRVVDAPRPETRVGRACVPVDHENLERFGWSERTDEGRRRVVRSALGFAAEIGVRVVVPPAETPRELPEGAVVVSQPPPQAFRSNGEWAGDLMKRVAGHYLADAEEGPRAVESLLFYGLTGRTSADYAGALAHGLGYLRDRQQAPAARTGRPWLPDGVAESDHAALRAALLERVAEAGDLWGSPESPYACARVLTRAHTERLCSPLALDAVRSELRPVPPSPYGDTLGGWFAWHLAETQPRFRGVRPGRARGGLQRVARRPGGRGPSGQGGPARSRRRRAGARLVGADPGRAGSLAGPARHSGRVRHGRERSGGGARPAFPEQAAAAARSRCRRRAGGVPRAGLPAPGGRRRSRGPHPGPVRRVRRRGEAPRLRPGPLVPCAAGVSRGPRRPRRPSDSGTVREHGGLGPLASGGGRARGPDASAALRPCAPRPAVREGPGRGREDVRRRDAGAVRALSPRSVRRRLARPGIRGEAGRRPGRRGRAQRDRGPHRRASAPIRGRPTGVLDRVGGRLRARGGGARVGGRCHRLGR